MIFTQSRGCFPASLYRGDYRIFDIIPIYQPGNDSRLVLDHFLVDFRMKKYNYFFSLTKTSDNGARLRLWQGSKPEENE
jgi:hypothetical protein